MNSHSFATFECIRVAMAMALVSTGSLCALAVVTPVMYCYPVTLFSYMHVHGEHVTYYLLPFLSGRPVVSLDTEKGVH